MACRRWHQRKATLKTGNGQKHIRERYRAQSGVQAAARLGTAAAPAVVAIPGIKARHQYAWDTNDWMPSGQMTGRKAPYGRLRFAGDEEELEDIAGFVEAEERLTTKVLKTTPAGGEAGGGRGGGRGKKNAKATEDV